MLTTVIAPLVFWVAAALKVRRLGDPAQRPITFALFCFAVALTLDVPRLSARLDAAVGVPNLSTLFAHLVALTGVFLLLRFFRQIAGEPALAVRDLALLVVVLAASTVTFLIASPTPERADFTEYFAHLSSVKAFWLITILYFAVCLWSLLRLSFGTSRRAGRAEVRRGFAAVGVGVVIGIAYSAMKVVEILGAESSAITVADHILLVLGALLIGVGLLYPVAAGAAASGRDQIRDRLLLFRLRPAWLRAVERSPGVVLGRRPSTINDLLGRGARYRLYRRVIEIRDATLESDDFMTNRDRQLIAESEPWVRAGAR